MATKMLSSFEIRGFRAFDHLKLTGLGRVNLIVGKNNVGKSSLLEALWVYVNQGSPNVLWSLLADRNESESLSSLRFPERTAEEIGSQLLAMRYLFHGRRESLVKQMFSLGPIDNEKDRLEVQCSTITITDIDTSEGGEDVLALFIKAGKESPLVVRLDRSFARRLREPFSLQEKKNVFVSANGLSSVEINQYWDNVALGALENDVLESLRIIDPRIERVTLVAKLKSSRERIPIVKISDFDQPLPLRSLGEGMNRIFGIALALVNAKGGILLMDEIESGLHYSIQENVWDFIFQTAKRLDIQVFATTHSWDCVTGFAQAANKSVEKGALIRLENKKGKIAVIPFDEKELAIAAREQIEVR